MYSGAESVFVLKHYFALKSFATVHEAFSNTYSDKVVQIKTIFRPLTEISGHTKCFDILAQFISLLEEH